MRGILQKLERPGGCLVLAGCLSLNMSAAAREIGVTSPTAAPPTWWTGMHNAQLQLMLRGEDIAHSQVFVNHTALKITDVASLDSPNYLFVDVDVSEAKAGDYTFTLKKNGAITSQFTYTLNAREHTTARGFDQQDTIYLIAPDRFANGDTENDSIDGLSDKHQPEQPGGRHGGDIQGIINHLDYLQHMGFSQIWSMPLLENAMDSYSYHGYAITDHYQIDPRYGSNSLYRQLSREAGKREIGIIMDVVLNHIGSNHPWMADLPSVDWVHHGGEFSPTTHRREALHDIHGVEADKNAFSDGWFVPTMPDLNQQNPYLATYLIQNALWWIEYAGLSGIRVDTYSYSDKAFLTRWTKALMDQYPRLNIVGEEWTTNPVITSYWQQGSDPADGYQSSLPSVMDFPLQQHPEAVTGKYLHYVPEAGIYVYFRLDAQGTPVMMGILNKNVGATQVKLERFAPQLSKVNRLARLKDNKTVAATAATLAVPAQSATVWLLQ